MELKEQIVNLETGEITWRDYTPEEIAAFNAKKEQNEAKAAEAAAKEAARAELLARLGITADEAKLLLGGN